MTFAEIAVLIFATPVLLVGGFLAIAAICIFAEVVANIILWIVFLFFDVFSWMRRKLEARRQRIEAARERKRNWDEATQWAKDNPSAVEWARNNPGK